MLYKKTENLEGKYEDISRQRFDLLMCNEAFTPEGLNVGWGEYPTKAKALKKLGISETKE